MYTLIINGKIAAFLLFSIYDDNDAYLVNITYDPKYSKYGIGTVLYYYCIEEMIKRKIKKIYTNIMIWGDNTFFKTKIYGLPTK